MSDDKTMVHVVNKPPLTDEFNMLGMYMNLFLVLGIEVPTSFIDTIPPANSFQHPIPEENAKMIGAFFETSLSLQGMVSHSKLALKNIQVNRHNVTFLFVVKK